jgi:hypothetical protein
MFLRRLPWAQLVKGGVPPLFVLRPLANFTPPTLGAEYPAPVQTDKFQMLRARQLYEQRRVGTKAELDVVVAKAAVPAPAEPPLKHPAKAKKEKPNG